MKYNYPTFFDPPSSMREKDNQIAILMKGITKRFPGVVANDHINFEVRIGEIHALLGENGAGKTTLMNILYGLYQPDEGEIYVWGKKVKIRSPRDALKLGIGMVHQHFKLVDSLTVAENITLGLKNVRIILPLSKVKHLIRNFSTKFGLKVDPDARVWQLSAGERQRVEILKALIHGARILILDEPTTVLTPIERNELFKILRRMKNEGCSIIFITHKLEEVFLISDRVTILRHGKVVTTLDTKNTTPEELSKLMIGRELIVENINKKIYPKYNFKDKKPILKVDDLYVLNDKGALAVRGVSFSIYPGEIFGIAGISGNGQRELIEAIVGLRKVKQGHIYIMNKEVTNSSPGKILRKGIAYIPEDRINVGIIPDMSIKENLLLKNYWKYPFSGKIFINMSYVDEWSKKLINEYGIVAPSNETPAKLLSGGNIQRVILARELSSNPHLIIAVHPTYGLDIAATQYVHSLLIEQKKHGSSILLVSEDPEEILKLCDYIAVMFEGHFINVMSAEDTTLEDIYLMMSGVKRK